MGKSDTNTKNHTQKKQEVSPLQQVTTEVQRTDKTVRQRQTRNTNVKKDPQKNISLERSVRKLLEGLNMFDGTNLTLITDVDT